MVSYQLSCSASSEFVLTGLLPTGAGVEVSRTTVIAGLVTSRWRVISSLVPLPSSPPLRVAAGNCVLTAVPKKYCDTHWMPAVMKNKITTKVSEL